MIGGGGLGSLASALASGARTPKSGFYFCAPRPSAPISNVAIANGWEYATDPWDFAAAITIVRLAVRVAVAAVGSGGAGTKTIRLGLRAAAADGNPGALIVDGGTIDATSVTAQEVTISTTVGPGRVWPVLLVQGCDVSGPQLFGVTADGFGQHATLATLIGSAIGSFIGGNGALTSGGFGAAWPTAAQTGTGAHPTIFGKAA